jgi:hypothetical protein
MLEIPTKNIYSSNLELQMSAIPDVSGIETGTALPTCDAVLDVGILQE